MVDLAQLLEDEIKAELRACDEREARYLGISSLANEIVTHIQQQREYLLLRLSRLDETKRRYPSTSTSVSHAYLDAAHEE